MQKDTNVSRKQKKIAEQENMAPKLSAVLQSCNGSKFDTYNTV